MQPHRRRKKYLIYNEVQIKYAIFSIVMLTLYTAILLIAIFGPSILIFTSPDLPLSVRAEAANTLIHLHSYIWPGIGTIIVLFGILSIFITHRLAGPIFVIQRAMGQIAQGDLTVRVRLRRKSELLDLAQSMNHMMEKLDSSLSVLGDRFRNLSSRIRELSPGQESMNKPEILAELEAIEKILGQYALSNTKRKE